MQKETPGVPFEADDPFYSEENQAELRRRLEGARQGLRLAPHELIEEEEEEDT